MTLTEFLAITKLSESQASPKTTVNEALDIIDAHLDSSKTMVVREDFIGRTSVNGAILIESASGTGADVDCNVVASQAIHPGIASLTTGTDTTGYASLISRSSSAIVLGGGVWKLRAVFYVDDLSDGTDTYTLRIGFGDSSVGAEPVDAVELRYSHSVNSGKFEAVTRSNSTETATDTGVTVAADTWYRLDVTVNADASSVDFYLRQDDTGDSELVATNAANIPSGTGRETGVQLSIIKSAGTTARLVHVDLVEVRCEFTDPR